MTDSIDVKTIKDPKFVKTLSHEGLLALCQALRDEIITQVSKNGGHLSPNLGVIELTVALHRVFDFSHDKLIMDVGHQCYANKILTGRSLDNMGEKGATSCFQNRDESIYDCYDAGHSSTSLSAAEGFAMARDRKGENYEVVVLIGDSSIANGLAFEALNNVTARKEKVIIIINDNDMSIAQPVGSMSLQLKALAKMKRGDHSLPMDHIGFDYIGPIKGHDLEELEEALTKAKNSKNPVLVHVLTKKGKGYKYAEEDKEGIWHGVEPFDIETGKPLNVDHSKISWSELFANLTEEMLDKHPLSQLLVPGTVPGEKLISVFKTHPEQCIDVGIAEEHSLSLAGALSLNGVHPIVDIYSCFLQRAYDEASHDCARFDTPMTILVDHAGLVDKQGPTHQGIYDVAFLKSIPNILITMPSNPEEAKALYRQSYEDHGVFAIRFPTEKIERKEIKDIDLPFKKFSFIQETSKENAVVAIGPLGAKLHALLKESHLPLTLVNPIYLNSFNCEDLKKLASFKKVYVYDPYSTKEGFAGCFLTAILLKGFKGEAKIRCVPTDFIEHASWNDLINDLGLNINDVEQEIKEFIEA